jgi:hypothetical protein
MVLAMHSGGSWPWGQGHTFYMMCVGFHGCHMGSLKEGTQMWHEIWVVYGTIIKLSHHTVGHFFDQVVLNHYMSFWSTININLVSTYHSLCTPNSSSWSWLLMLLQHIVILPQISEFLEVHFYLGICTFMVFLAPLCWQPTTMQVQAQ